MSVGIVMRELTQTSVFIVGMTALRATGSAIMKPYLLERWSKKTSQHQSNENSFKQCHHEWLV
jgi:hypothetical protein